MLYGYFLHNEFYEAKSANNTLNREATKKRKVENPAILVIYLMGKNDSKNQKKRQHCGS